VFFGQLQLRLHRARSGSGVCALLGGGQTWFSRLKPQVAAAV
jgi:hypothetical protein